MEGVAHTFLGKLKEQSFTIILMACILFYQNKLFNDAKERYEQTIDEKDSIIKTMYEDERQRFLSREQYLMEQRDTYVEDLISNNK